VLHLWNVIKPFYGCSSSGMLLNHSMGAPPLECY
jgi:hypothetical protein